MTYTKHILKRMSQRGISSNMVLLTLKYGRVDKDKFVLDRKSLKSLIKETEETRRDLFVHGRLPPAALCGMGNQFRVARFSPQALCENRRRGPGGIRTFQRKRLDHGGQPADTIPLAFGHRESVDRRGPDRASCFRPFLDHTPSLVGGLEKRFRNGGGTRVGDGLLRLRSDAHAHEG